MGVYENLLKKKLITENEDGSVTTNNDRAVSKMQSKDWQQDTQTKTDVSKVTNNLNSGNLWDQVKSLATSMVVNNAKSIANLTGLGISRGTKNVPYYLENFMEQYYPSYKENRKQNFLNPFSKANEDERNIIKANDELNKLKLIANVQKKELPENLLNIATEIEEKANNIETNLTKRYWQESIAEDNKKIQEEQSKLTDPIAKKLGEVAPSMGEMLPGTVLSAVNPALGFGYFYTSAGGSYMQDGLDRGMTEKEAWNYANIMATLESASETVITGQKVNKVMKAFGGKEISKAVLNSYGFNALENAVQEAVMEPAQELTAQLVAGNDKANWDGIMERMGTSALNGALMGVISNGATFGLEQSGKAYNKIKNGESLTKNEINAVIQENIKARGKEKIENEFKQGANQVFQQVSTIQNKQSNTQEQQITPSMQENASNQNVVANSQDREKRLQELKSIDTSNMGFIERGKIKTEIRALEQGFNSIEEYQKAEQIKREQAQKEYEQRQKEKELKKIKKQQQLEKEIQESNPTKRAQYEIIQNTNPMLDDYHTGIRSPKDIKTFNEVINDEESFAWGDFSREDAQNALEQGKITIYSSYPIENGTFVSTSKVQAEDYAGGKGKKVYSKEVPLEEVAWINGDEGQYAKVDNLANNRQTLYNNLKLGEVKKIPIQEVLNLKTDGGYRNEQQMSILREDIKQNGIKNPIELVRKNDGSIEIENGNHRLQIANELGLKEVPIKFVESWENIGKDINVQEKIKLQGVDEEYERTNGNIKETNSINAPIGINERNSTNNSNEFENGTARTENDRIPRGVQEYNNRSSSDTTYEKNSNEQSKINLPIKETSNEASFNLPTKGEKINWNEAEKPEEKIRKHYRSIIESSNTTAQAKAIAKELMGTDTYVPESNKKHINDADTRIQYNGADKELTTLSTNVFNGDKRVTAVDIAVGERLIEYYSKIGDKAKLQEAIRATAMAGTQAGQTVQALSLLNHQTPQGQAIWIDRSVNKLNQQIKKQRGENAPQFSFTAEMEQKILNSENAEELQQNLNEVYKELGQQVPKSTIEKIDSWRYFSMLANPKTHIRNMVGNLFMAKTQTVKNKVAGAIEGVVSKANPKMEREHTIAPASKKTKAYAKNDIKNVIDRLGIGENKYTPQTRLQSEQRTFKSDILENTLGKMFDLNSNLLEAEDNIGLKAGYVKAFSEYITANKIDVDHITDTQLSKARNYAVQQAQEATFHQASSLATLLNQLNKNKSGKFLMDSILPFKKTPINVAKTGFQYSPMQIIKSVTTDLSNLRKGNITVNQYIDNVSKGLTGTGIALVGYALADAGILKASGSDDDRKEKYDEAMGKQTYSIQIGDKTYTLDWLAPTGIPLFIGVEANEIMKENGKEKGSKSTDDSSWNKAVDSAKNILDAFTNSMNPMTEMSMLSGLTNSLKSYNSDSSQMFADIGTNMTKSYVNQFVPTALSQIARTTDNYERDTTSTANGVLPKAIDSTINQIKSKIPGLRQTLPTKTDIWGKDVKQETNLPLRALKNAVFPWTEKDISNTSVDKELSSLYNQIGESSILPQNINKTLTLDKETYRMTNEEYNKYKKDFGNTSFKILENLFETKEYKGLPNDQKQIAIENAYKYAKELNKQNYSKEVSVDINTTNMYNTMQKLNSKGQSQYITYLAKTNEIEKEKDKNEVLKNLDIDNNTKYTIYANNTGKDDKMIDLIPNIKMNQYLNYKIRASNEEFSADKDKNGKTISGSAKAKIYEYVNNNITGYENRLMLLANKYKLSREEQQKIVEYINKNSKTNDEVVSKLEKLSNNFQVKDGKVYFK